MVWIKFLVYLWLLGWAWLFVFIAKRQRAQMRELDRRLSFRRVEHD